MGAFTAAITFGIGTATNLTAGQQLFARAVTGGLLEGLQGGNFGSGFVAAGLTAMFMPQLGGYSAPVRTALGALIGGTISAATGGKFANGAISGAIQGAMARAPRTNHAGGDAPADPKKAALAMKSATRALAKSGFYDNVANGVYKSERAIAAAWGRIVYPIGHAFGVEIGAWIAQAPTGAWTVSGAHSDGAYDWVQPDNAKPSLYKASAWVHTHPMAPGGEHLSGSMIHLRKSYGELIGATHDFDGDVPWALRNEMNIYSYGGELPRLSSFIYNDAVNKAPTWSCYVMEPMCTK